MWNIANALTAIRILLVPIFVWLLLSEDGSHTGLRVAALIVFVVAMATDQADGALARRRGITTDVGAIADPIADKILTGAAFVSLSLMGDIPWWITGVILLREWGVTAVRFAVIRYGVIPASRGGKLKTLLQAVVLVLYIAPLGDGFDEVKAGILGVTVVVTVVTGADYLVQALRIRRGR